MSTCRIGILLKMQDRGHIDGQPGQRPSEPRSKPSLMEQQRDELRLRHRSLATERAYLGWVREFILFHEKRHPREMGNEEIQTFLTYLAKHRGVAANTQNQALSAILFLYRWVLGREVGALSRVVRVRRPARLP